MKIFCSGILFSFLIIFACKSPNNDQLNADGAPTLFLLSNGLKNEVLQSTLSDLLKDHSGSLKVAVIVNATSSTQKRLEKVGKVKTRFSKAGLDTTNIMPFDLTKDDPLSLRNFDVVYTLGGNPFLLFAEVKSSGADLVLKQFPSDRLLMGYSAGTMLLGPGLELMQSVDSLLGFNDIGLHDLTGLSLYDFYIFPHYEDFTSEEPALAEAILNFEKQTGSELVRMNDGEGIIIENGQMRTIR